MTLETVSLLAGKPTESGRTEFGTPGHRAAFPGAGVLKGKIGVNCRAVVSTAFEMKRLGSFRV